MFKLRCCRRRGQSLVEFALVALVTYLLLAAILTFGFYFYAGQGSQGAVDLAARELSRVPLTANKATLEQVLYGNPNSIDGILPEESAAIRDARRRVFDEHYLVLREEDLLDETTGTYSREFLEQLPLVNQQLVPLMIFDTIEGVRVFRYPGAIYRDTDPSDDPIAGPAPSGFLVAIPLVVARDGEGHETIRWVRVLEPIVTQSSDNLDRIDPFRISSPERGIVALRLNYPVEAATMSSFRKNPGGPFEPNLAFPNLADDAQVQIEAGTFAPSGELLASDRQIGPYTGQYGLGRQLAFAQEVRPFRRVISAQAIFRRDVFD
ncbi:MAG TPA: TadE family protein [Pirellulaceae bacterium]|nr:TadE family protein [Pirellulaceae bacterium]